jgi:putative salt-induced outer membrane protein YdiY
MMDKSSRAAALLGALFFVFSSVVHAGVLVLTNGDRITGDIKKIWDGEIYVEPSYSDEFTVDVEAVQYMEDEEAFDIELVEGQTQTAKLLGADEEGRQLLEVDGALVAIPLAQLLELEEEEEYFDWEVNVDVSAGVNKGNTNSENGRLRADGTLKVGDHRQRLDVTFNREIQNDQPIQQQDLYQYSYNWFFNDAWFLGAGASYERDPIRDLDGRVIAAALVGRDVWNAARRFLNVQGGLGFQSERIGGINNQSSVAIWALRFRYDLFKGDFSFNHKHSLTYNITGRDNTVLKTSTSLDYELNDVITLKFSVDYDYESQPADLATNSDLSTLFGIGLEFD